MNTVDFLNRALNNLFDGLWATHANTIESITWKDEHKTTISEAAAIGIEVARLQTEYNAQEYARLRANEYPPIGDQLDALWKGGDAAAEMLARVQAVKNKYPKPAE